MHISIVDISTLLKNINIDMAIFENIEIIRRIWKILVSILIRRFWKISISISIWRFWEISIKYCIDWNLAYRTGLCVHATLHSNTLVEKYGASKNNGGGLDNIKTVLCEKICFSRLKKQWVPFPLVSGFPQSKKEDLCTFIPRIEKKVDTDTLYFIFMGQE